MDREQERLFWYWVNERHRIYVRKNGGVPWPWTDDPILRKYKFTNVFRRLDAETVRLGHRLAALRPNTNRLRLLRHILVFRLFCWHETYDTLLPIIDRWDLGRAHELIRDRRHKKVFTGAYIIPNIGSREPKVNIILDVATRMWCDAPALLQEIRWHNRVEKAVEVFRRYHTVGGFIAYELACDLTYVPILRTASDLMYWANPGPGAHRGLNRLHSRPLRERVSIEQANAEMRKLLSRHRTRNHVPPLQMRDIEHSLCEFDKYMRVKNEEGKPRSVYRQSKKFATVG